MSRRCMPSECPRHSVTIKLTANTSTAPGVTNMGQPMTAIMDMAPIQSDFTGFQRTVPLFASVSTASIMRGERKVLCAVASA